MRGLWILCLSTSACLASSGAEPVPEVTSSAESTTTTTTTGASITSSTTSDEPEVIFIARPDGAIASECDAYGQTCPMGQKCAWLDAHGSYSPELTACVPLAPEPLPTGAPCNYNVKSLDGLDECGIGEVCIESPYSGAPHDGIGACTAMCRGSSEHPYCEDGAVCIGGRTLWLCAPLCDPLAQDCPEGTRCDLFDWTPLCSHDPDVPKLGVGEACHAPWDCERGLTCLVNATPDCADGCCTTFCDRGDPQASCPLPGQTCQEPLPDQIHPSTEAVGVCRMESP